MDKDKDKDKPKSKAQWKQKLGLKAKRHKCDEDEDYEEVDNEDDDSLRVQNAVPTQPCVGKLGISLVLLNILHCNFILWFKTT